MWFIKMASMIHPSGSALLIKVELPWSEEKAPSLLCQQSDHRHTYTPQQEAVLGGGGGGGGEEGQNLMIER